MNRFRSKSAFSLPRSRALVEHLEPRQLLSVPYVYLNSQLLIGEGSTLMVGVGAFSASSNSAITVKYAVTPSASQDFEPLSGEVTVGPWNWPGSSGANIELKTKADNLIEGDEWVTITLLPDPEGSYVIGIYGVPPEYVPPGVGTATVQIVDSPPIATIERVSDGSEDGAPMVFRVARSGGKSSEPITLTYSISGTGANPASGGDYTAPSGQITIPADASSAILEVQVSDDSEIEAAYEQTMVTLTGGGMGQSYLVNAQASTVTATIQDNDFEIIAAAIGYNSQGLKKDDGNSYAGSSWNDLDGTPGQEDTSNPVSFQRSDSQQERFVTAVVTFELRGNPTSLGYQVRGSATGPAAGDFESQMTQVFEYLGVKTLSWGGVQLATLGTVIDQGTLSVDWSVVPSNAPNREINYGSTTNTMYVTGAAAEGEYETVVRIGCDRGKGSSPSADPSANEQLAMQIFTAFETRMMTRASDHTVLRYWGPEASVDYAQTDPAREGEHYTTAGLLKYADGRCGAWADFLLKVFSAQGLSSTLVGVETVTNTVSHDNRSYSAEGFQVYASLPAQGGTPSQARFADHALVGYGSKILDPSYGARHSYADPQQSRTAWAISSIEYMVYRAVDGSGDLLLLTLLDAPDPAITFAP